MIVLVIIARNNENERNTLLRLQVLKTIVNKK